MAVLSALMAGALAAAGPPGGPARICELTRTIAVRNGGTVMPVTLTLYIADITSWQNARVMEANHDPEPAERSVQDNGVTLLALPLTLKPGEERTFTSRWRIALGDFDALALRRAGGPQARQLHRCLRPSLLVESDDGAIIAAAARIAPGQEPLARARAIVAFVRGHLAYQRLTEYRGARSALETRRGDSLEYAALTAALCRAAGIPARVNSLLVMRQAEGRLRDDNHFNAEAFVAPWGWIPLEPFFDTGGVGRLMAAELVTRRGFGDESATSVVLSFNAPAKARGQISAEVRSYQWEWQP